MTKADLSVISLDPSFSGRRITADYVADGVRQAIQTGLLPDGAVLSQAAVSKRFGVSRVPVREAMRQLMAEGLIESRAHHISVVRGLSLERLSEIFENRALIEGALLAKAVPNVPEDVLEALKAEDVAMREEPDHSRWLQRNAAFHRTMNAYAGDETAMELVEVLRTRAERYAHLWSRGEGVHQPDRAGEQHAEILRRVLARDAAGARRALEEHVVSTGRMLVAYGQSLQDEEAAG